MRQHRSMCKHVTRELSTRYMFIEPREVSRCQEQGNHLAITTAHRVHTDTPQARAVITLTFVRGGGEVVFKNTYESLSVDGRCVPITERTSLT